MSYILDALRRAEAERQRGQVPGLGAQTTPAAADSDAPRRLPRAVWVGAALLTGAALLALGWWLRQPAPAPTTAALPAPGPAMAAPAPPASAAVALPMVVAAPAAAPPPPTLPPPAARPAPPPEPAPAVSRPVPPVIAPAAAPPSAPLALAALSPDLRRQLPPLALGGSIWSDNAAQRFIIVNGQIVREGETAAPGVVLERIGPRSAVLRWRELRIEWPL